MKTPADSAKAVLGKYWDGSLPVRPCVIAEKMGLQVIEDNELAASGLSGKFEFEDSGYPTIRYNPAEPTVRRRFTIAHELGHFMMGHKGVFRDPTQNFSLSNYDSREVAANKFAAELLMPGSAIRQLIIDNRIDELPRLAARFVVSEVAMKYRLQNLGWIS